MFRPPILQAPTFKLFLGLGLCTVGGAMLYAYFRVRDDDENADINAGTDKRTIPSFLGKKKEEKPVSLKLVIKVSDVALLIGRDGQNIPLIEEKTNTKIRFSDKDSTHKYCDIDGLPFNVKMSRDLILKEIERCQVVQEEFIIPHSVYNKIIGRCGEAMQEISRKSLAKICLDSEGSTKMDEKRLILTGNVQQVNVARKLLEDKVQEEEELRKAVEEVEQAREPRRSPTSSITSSIYSSQTSLTSQLAPKDKVLSYSNENKTMEVYVSALASPSKLWIQLVGPQTKKLFTLHNEMTEYYQCEENRKLHQIKEPYVGQIVAVLYHYVNKWHRAEIVRILPSKNPEEKVTIDLYFVDYGDSDYATLDDICELRTDFLTLRFQAVECFLANIKSTLVENPTAWPKAAIEAFEELTNVAGYKKMIARVVTFKNKQNVLEDSNSADIQSEETLIPGIELFDYCDGNEININEYMVKASLALPTGEYALKAALKSTNNTPTNTPSQTPSPSSSLSQSPSPSTSQSPTQSPSQSPTPFSSSVVSIPSNSPSTVDVATKDPHASAEDAHFQSQMEHLARNNNSVFPKGKTLEQTNPALLLNGNHNAAATAAATTNMPSKNLNGNLIA